MVRFSRLKKATVWGLGNFSSASYTSLLPSSDFLVSDLSHFLISVTMRKGEKFASISSTGK